MPLTKAFKEGTKARADREPEFRAILLCQAIEALLGNDFETGKRLLRTYVKATVGFERLARDMNKNPKSLMRMLSATGNPRADSLLAMIACLKQREGLAIFLTKTNRPHG